MHDVLEKLQGGLLGDRPDLTIMEIGCANGQDSGQLVRLFPRARIICFEPDPRNVYWLKKEGAERFVTLIDAAVSDTDGTATFNLSGGMPPGVKAGANSAWTQSSSLKRPTGHLKDFPWCKFEKTAKVRTVRLDTFTREHKIDRVDFIWADVQGAEDLLIAGGQETLARTRYFFTEVFDGGWYEGQIGLEEILRRLPGGPEAWEIVERYKIDVLLRNRRFN